jgi:hypothetical protein
LATRLTVAFVLPTPPSTYALQLIDRFALTTHWGVPDLRWELPGAFAESKLSAVGVYVPGETAASAGTAAKAVTSSDSTAIMPIFLNIKRLV